MSVLHIQNVWFPSGGQTKNAIFRFLRVLAAIIYYIVLHRHSILLRKNTYVYYLSWPRELGQTLSYCSYNIFFTKLLGFLNRRSWWLLNRRPSRPAYTITSSWHICCLRPTSKKLHTEECFEFRSVFYPQLLVRRAYSYIMMMMITYLLLFL